MKEDYKNKFIGKIIDDLQCIGISSKKGYIIVKCLKCGREKEKNYRRFNQHIGTTHKNCVHLIDNISEIYKSSFYSSWVNMRNRVENTKIDKYKNYGGRGINNEQFKLFVDFYDLMYESYIEHVKKIWKK